MDGRRVYHARGKVLGGSSSINGMIFQRGNPLDYERWAADPGMETWDYAHCLPYFKRMEDCTAAAADDPWRGHGGPLGLERGPATQPAVPGLVRGRPAGRLPADDDVNGYRQEGVAPFDRNIRRGRRMSAARAYLPRPVRRRKNLSVRTSTLVTRILFEGRRAVGVEIERHGRRDGDDPGRRDHPGRRRVQHAAAPPARGRRGGRRPRARSGSRSSPTCRASARTSRTTSRSTSSTARASPSRCSRPRRSSGAGRSSGPSGCSCARGPGATNHFEGGGFVRSNDDVAYPNLMFHFLPLAIRYDGTPAPSEHGYQVHVGPMYSDARGCVRITSTDPARPPGDPLQLPLDRPGSARVGGGGPDGAANPRPSRRSTPYSTGELSPGRGRRDGRGDPRLGRAGRRDGAPSVVHGADGRRRRLGGRPADDAGPRARGPAGGRRERHARTSPTATSTRRS